MLSRNSLAWLLFGPSGEILTMSVSSGKSLTSSMNSWVFILTGAFIWPADTPEGSNIFLTASAFCSLSANVLRSSIFIQTFLRPLAAKIICLSLLNCDGAILFKLVALDTSLIFVRASWNCKTSTDCFIGDLPLDTKSEFTIGPSGVPPEPSWISLSPSSVSVACWKRCSSTISSRRLKPARVVLKPAAPATALIVPTVAPAAKAALAIRSEFFSIFSPAAIRPFIKLASEPS